MSGIKSEDKPEKGKAKFAFNMKPFRTYIQTDDINISIHKELEPKHDCAIGDRFKKARVVLNSYPISDEKEDCWISTDTGSETISDLLTSDTESDADVDEKKL